MNSPYLAHRISLKNRARLFEAQYAGDDERPWWRLYRVSKDQSDPKPRYVYYDRTTVDGLIWLLNRFGDRERWCVRLLTPDDVANDEEVCVQIIVWD